MHSEADRALTCAGSCGAVVAVKGSTPLLLVNFEVDSVPDDKHGPLRLDQRNPTVGRRRLRHLDRGFPQTGLPHIPNAAGGPTLRRWRSSHERIRLISRG